MDTIWMVLKWTMTDRNPPKWAQIIIWRLFPYRTTTNLNSFACYRKNPSCPPLWHLLQMRESFSTITLAQKSQLSPMNIGKKFVTNLKREFAWESRDPNALKTMVPWESPLILLKSPKTNRISCCRGSQVLAF